MLAFKPDFVEGSHLLGTEPMHFGGLLMTRSVIANCMMVRDALLKFLTYQLSMERYWLTMVLTDNGELEFDPGEGA